MDLLVSIAVMGILVAVLLPALGAARSAALRAACASNVKQLGLGLSGYAFDNDSRLPRSVIGDGDGGRTTPRPQDSVFLRYETERGAGDDRIPAVWDGLGVLYDDARVPAPPVFYCPAYTGEFTLERYRARFPKPNGEIVGNYQYRSEAGGVRISRIPSVVSVISGSMRSKSEYSHPGGHNLFRIDLSVDWFDDSSGRFRASLPDADTPTDAAADAVLHAWDWMDRPSAGSDATGKVTPVWEPPGVK